MGKIESKFKYIITIKDNKISVPTALNVKTEEIETMYPIVGLSQPFFIKEDGEVVMTIDGVKTVTPVKKNDAICISQANGAVLVFKSDEKSIEEYNNAVEALIQLSKAKQASAQPETEA